MEKTSKEVVFTNYECTNSKYIVSGLGLFDDIFIYEFVDKIFQRSPQIILGYLSRMQIINEVIGNYLRTNDNSKIISKFQFIILGSGFDTCYWRFNQHLRKCIFIEIDFSEVITKKILKINNSKLLKSYLNKVNTAKIPLVNQLSDNYFLLEADLNNLNTVEELFSKIQIDYDVPTMFLSECALMYLNRRMEIIKWVENKFAKGFLVDYTPLPSKHIFSEKLKAFFFLYDIYKDLNLFNFRGTECDFKNVFLLPESRRIIFDEYEGLSLKNCHYGFFSYGKNDLLKGRLSRSMVPDEFYCKSMYCGKKRRLTVDIFGHSSCRLGNDLFIFGGQKEGCRSSLIYKVNTQNLSTEVLQCSKQRQTDLVMMHGTLTTFKLNGKRYFCTYGGRIIPGEPCNLGQAVVYQYYGNRFYEVFKTTSLPGGRYRCSMVSETLDRFTVDCWIFGGKATNNSSSPKELLNDVLRLQFFNKGKTLCYNWIKYENGKNGKLWPSPRMSHGASLFFDFMFISGGWGDLSMEPLNDVWVWSTSIKSWEKLKIKGLLPRFGHTSHFIKGKLYLLGGVNDFYNYQPSLAIIDVLKDTCQEYSLKVAVDNTMPAFINHSSEVIKCNNKYHIVTFGGGVQSFILPYVGILNSYIINTEEDC